MNYSIKSFRSIMLLVSGVVCLLFVLSACGRQKLPLSEIKKIAYNQFTTFCNEEHIAAKVISTPTVTRFNDQKLWMFDFVTMSTPTYHVTVQVGDTGGAEVSWSTEK